MSIYGRDFNPIAWVRQNFLVNLQQRYRLADVRDTLDSLPMLKSITPTIDADELLKTPSYAGIGVAVDPGAAGWYFPSRWQVPQGFKWTLKLVSVIGSVNSTLQNIGIQTLGDGNVSLYAQSAPVTILNTPLNDCHLVYPWRVGFYVATYVAGGQVLYGLLYDSEPIS